MEAGGRKWSLVLTPTLVDGATSGEYKKYIYNVYNSLSHHRSHNFSPSAWGTLSRAKAKKRPAGRGNNLRDGLDEEDSEDGHAPSINVCILSGLSYHLRLPGT